MYLAQRPRHRRFDHKTIKQFSRLRVCSVYYTESLVIVLLHVCPRVSRLLVSFLTLLSLQTLLPWQCSCTDTSRLSEFIDFVLCCQASLKEQP